MQTSPSENKWCNSGLASPTPQRPSQNFLWEYAYYVLATENFWTYTVISAAPSLQKIGPKYKNLFNFSDFSSVQPLANPHKIRYIQKYVL